MDNNELAHLIHRKGLDNMVEVKGEDLHRLLELQQPYDFLMEFVKRLAEYPYTEDDHRESMENTNKAFQQAWDHVVHGCIDQRAGFALISLCGMVDKAKWLRSIYPPSSWEPDPPADGG